MSPLHCLLIIVLCGRHTHESSAGTKAFFIAVFGFIILPCRALTEKRAKFTTTTANKNTASTPLLYSRKPPNTWLSASQQLVGNIELPDTAFFHFPI